MATVTLAEPDDFGRFSVVVIGEPHDELTALIAHAGIGRLHTDGEHVVVDPAALRAMRSGGGEADMQAWDEGFASMRTYAATKGWVEPDGGLLAHIEFLSGESTEVT